jgi:hypothetical protein
LTAISFPTTNHLHRCLAATEIQKFQSFSMTGATRGPMPADEACDYGHRPAERESDEILVPARLTKDGRLELNDHES